MYPLITGLTHLLTAIHVQVGNWGWAIILLTVGVRLLLYPLAREERAAKQRMREIEPELAQLRDRHAGDRAQEHRARIELYRARRVNPMMACAPTLLQCPVVVALYSALATNNSLRGAPFELWIADLSRPDPAFVLPVILGLSLLSQSASWPRWTAGRWSLFVFAVCTSLRLAAGLQLYMVTSSLLSSALPLLFGCGRSAAAARSHWQALREKVAKSQFSRWAATSDVPPHAAQAEPH